MVQITDEQVLIFLTFVVCVPTGAVDEIQIVRHLDESHAALHEPSRKHLWIASAYSTYAGIVLFMIHDLSQPFHGLIVLQPDAFRQALAAIHSGI